MDFNYRCLRKFFVVLLMLASLISMVINVQPVSAATIVVDTENDNQTAGDGYCTLREAINNAKTHTDMTTGDCIAGELGLNTITLPAGTYTLDSQIATISNSEIVINGADAESTIIQASACNPVTLLPEGCTPATYQIFNLGTGTNLTLNNLTLRHGVGDDGGAINTGSATLIISNSIFSGNLAGYSGGAIYMHPASVLDLSDSTITGNSSGVYGGGITITGDGTITDSIIQANEASMYGGGVQNAGTLEILGSTISENETNGTFSFGGGIHNNMGGTVTITNCIINNNDASTRGGAIENKGSVTVTNSTLSGNTAINSGGGIYNYHDADLDITSSTLSGNHAGDDGGGIYCERYVSLWLTDSTLSENTAVNEGGGILTEGDGISTEITGSILTGNSAAIGGGIYNDGETMSVIDSTFSLNVAEDEGEPSDAGAILNAVGSMLDIESSTFLENSGRFGGAIQNLGDLEIINSTFSGNIASIRGGGIYNFEDLNLINNSFTGNESAFGGAGIENHEGSWLDFTNTIIANSIIGADCNNEGGGIGTNNKNLVEDGTCGAEYSGDPLLGILADNGGPTQTHALLEGSPAIDTGYSETCPATDQRGVLRPQGGGCDIGAFEVGDYIFYVYMPMLLK